MNKFYVPIFSPHKDRQPLIPRKRNLVLKMIPVQTMIMSPSKRKMIPLIMPVIQMMNLQKKQKLRLKRRQKILVRIATLIQIRRKIRKCQLPICPKPMALPNRKNNFCLDTKPAHICYFDLLSFDDFFGKKIC